MQTLTIDGQSIAVPEGTTVLSAARKLGIDIPALCDREGHPPLTSCMVCLVKVDGRDRLVPSCATLAREGMQVESETEEVRSARRAALELLLGDHLGDCIAPCQTACPAGLNIPRIIRAIANGLVPALPPLPCRACDTRCEKVCRRAAKDHAVSIRLLILHARRQNDTFTFRAASQSDDATAPQPDTVQQAPQPRHEFSVHIGRIPPEEIEAFMAGASPNDRTEPANGSSFSDDEARQEARRCLHCDCRRPDDCKLRHYATIYRARSSHYTGPKRPFQQQITSRGVIFEPGKCIACGICVEVAREAGEPLGLTFVGRGFDVRIGVPLEHSLDEGLQRAGAACVRACPTGALAFRDDPKEP